MGAIGRLYFYVVAFITLFVVAFGAGSLLSSVGKFFLDQGGTLTTEVEYWRSVLSAYVPILVVGGPLWAVHWLAAQRRAAHAEEEQQAMLRKLFLNAALTVSALAALFNLVRLVYHSLAYATGASAVPIGLPGKLSDVYNAFVWLIVYGLIWYYHWQVEREEGQSTSTAHTLRRWRLYLVALVSLNVLGIGLFLNLSLLISFLIGEFARQIAGAGIGAMLKTWSLTFAPVFGGAAWWSFHWLYAARRDTASLLRNVYLYFLVFVGLAITVGGLGGILYQALRFAFGYRAPSVTAQLSFLQLTLPALLIGGATWAYHWNVVHEEAVSARGALAGVRRRYNYLVSLFGLLSLAIGLASLIRVLLEMGFQVGQELNRAPDWWRDQLSLFTVMAALGLAVWIPHWTSVQDLVEEEGAVERDALSRRLALYLVIFASVISILFNGAFLLNGLLRLVLGEPATRRFISTIFSNVGNVAVVGVFLYYHWRVLRLDREFATETATEPAKSITALAPTGLQGRVRQLEEVLGRRITLLQEVATVGEQTTTEAETPELAPDELHDLARKIRAAPSDKVFLVFSSSQVEVHPYR